MPPKKGAPSNTYVEAALTPDMSVRTSATSGSINSALASCRRAGMPGESPKLRYRGDRNGKAMST